MTLVEGGGGRESYLLSQEFAYLDFFLMIGRLC